MFPFITSADGGPVAARGEINPLLACDPQESKCMLPLLGFITSTDCRALGDDVWCRSSLARLQHQQCYVSKLAFLTSPNG